jgi:hypothetical protein
MDLLIDAQGVWHHNGSPIHRRSLCKLFSKIMRCESDGAYYLLTPTEKWRIRVEDTPFRIVDFKWRGPHCILISDMDDEIVLDEKHPLRLDSGPAPVVMVRHDLDARLSRNIFYHLVDLAVPKTVGSQRKLFLKSGTMEFCLGNY